MLPLLLPAVAVAVRIRLQRVPREQGGSYADSSFAALIVTSIYLHTHREEIEQLAIDGADAIFGVHGKVYDPINSADLCKGHIHKKCGV